MGYKQKRKDESCFQLENGTHRKQCRICKKVYIAKDMLEHFGLSSQSPDRFRYDCRSCIKISAAIYRKSPGFYERQAQRAKLNWKKTKARSLINNSIASGKSVKPKTCSNCGLETDIHGHHTDYSKPFDVMWLCPRCHMRQHRIESGREIVPVIATPDCNSRFDYKRSMLRPSKVTNCPAGHPYDGKNLDIDKGGKRHCRSCKWYRNKGLKIKPEIPERFL